MHFVRNSIIVLAFLTSTVGRAASIQSSDLMPILLPQVETIFAKMYADFHVPNNRVSTAILDSLNMISDGTLRNGLVTFDGCRPHSCDEKGAVTLDVQTKRLVAVALRHFNCRDTVFDEVDVRGFTGNNVQKPPVRCDKDPTITIYVIRRTALKNDFLNEAIAASILRQWGKKVGAVREEVRVVLAR